MNQSESLIIIFISCLNAVAVFDELALPLRVVVNVLDSMLGSCVRVKQPSRLGVLLQPDFHTLQQVRFIINRLGHIELRPGFAAVRRYSLDRAVEGVIETVVGEGFSLKLRVLRPVNLDFVIREQLTSASH